MTTALPDGTPTSTGASTSDAPNVSDLSVAGDFPTPDRDAWESLVASVLRKSGDLPEGADPHTASHRLASTTLDGLIVEPLYTAGPSTDLGFPGVTPFVRGRSAGGHVRSGWDVRQRHENPDAVASRAAVLADLENGVTSVWLVLGDRGIAIADLPTVLADVRLDLAPVVLEAGPDSAAAADAFFGLAARRGIALTALRGNLGFDPFGDTARSGIPQPLAETVAWAARCISDAPEVRAITVDATPYHEAGASDAQELGASLATGVAYLRALEAAGVPVADAAAQLEFRYAASADQFLTIAKLRAGRRLWARCAEVCDIPTDHRGQFQHAVTSWAMTTQRDPWVNMLRDTLACVGAGIGGADAVTVLPFDAAIGLPDPFARRIARNTQTVLIEESNLARVIDPAGGSWYVESLTTDLAVAAWRCFQEIEAAGGIAAALSSGFLPERIAATRAVRATRISRREDALVGVSEFPLLDEARLTRPATATGKAGGLPRLRYAEPFEALRDRSDAHLAATGRRPSVFLAGIGSPKDRSARLSFAGGAMSPGGIETTTSTASDLDGIADEFEQDPSTVAILCSSDPVYAERAAETAGALKKRGARLVLLAGKPGERESDYRAGGIDGFVHVGSDIVATLHEVYDALGVR